MPRPRMKARAQHIQDRLLLVHLRWLIRLRWLAGVSVIVIGLLDGFALHRYDRPARFAALGAGVLAYNALLWWAVRRAPRHLAVTLAWAQMLLDLLCLTLIAIWSGGPASPIRGFFVFHMVFASLLLTRPMAYLAGTAAVLMFILGLLGTGQMPHTVNDQMLLAGWACTMLITVFITNHITRNLRRHFQRLVRGNQRIRALADSLARHQQSMIQQEKMVAMGQMAAGIVHEINNPLASMDSVVQLMHRNPERVTPDRIATLRQQIDRVKTTVQELTGFAHPIDYGYETLPVVRLADLAVQVVRFDKRWKNVKVEQRLGGEGVITRVQPHAMQQVLTNLMINALDAMADKPDPRITLETGANGQWCWITITDNGPGIPPQVRERMFEPFFTTKPVGKGTGLGLAISYKLMEKQGGRIEVQSATPPETGASMRVMLPVLPGTTR